MTMTIWTRRWAGAISVCVMMALAGTATAADDPPASSAAGGSSAPNTKHEDAGVVADRLLAKAPSPAEAALAWLTENPGASDEPAEARLAKAIEESSGAMAALPAPGVRFFDVSAGAWVGDAPVAPARVVLLVGGLDDARTIFETAAPAIGAAVGKDGAGVRVARFDCAGDRPLRSAGDALGATLRELGARGVKRVDLVGHSAGGLIVRDVLTRADLYNGFAAPIEGSKGQGLPRIGRVVLVGVPGRGTWLAPILAAREVRAQLARWIDAEGRDADAFAAFFGGTPGEVLRDLVPGSAYLTELNARPAPKWTKSASSAPDDVPVTVVVGTLAGGSALEGVDARPMFAWPIVRQAFKDGDAEKALAALDELGKVVGDGVTPVASAELEGADDVVYAEANHRSLLRPWVQGETEQPPAVKVIVERLK